MIFLNSSYSNWDYSKPENAVLGVALHSFEWLFVRVLQIIFIVLAIGVILTKKNKIVI